MALTGGSSGSSTEFVVISANNFFFLLLSVKEKDIILTHRKSFLRMTLDLYQSKTLILQIEKVKI